MLVVLKIAYIVYDYVTALLAGNYYKLAASFITKHLYKKQVAYERVLRFDGASQEIANKREEALVALSEKFKKFDYGSENQIKSTDTKLNPNCKMYVPHLFASITQKYKFCIPHLWTGYDEETGYKLVDIRGNKCFDLSSGNGANIIGNKKINELAHQKPADSRVFASGFATLSTKQCIDKLLSIYNRDHKTTDSTTTTTKRTKRYDCVSFCESGSAAVEACILQSRFYHSEFGDVERKKVVFFRNAYHGWIRNPYINDSNSDGNLVVLDALSVASIEYIIANYLKIAAIFVDPMKVLSVNKIYPRESLTVGKRESVVDVELYLRWLRKLEDVCKTYGILFVLDECYSGFRVGAYGACIEYALNPDMIILSKQLGCSLNTTVIVGESDKMQRKKGELAQVVFTTGTGSTNPQHHETMNRFLEYALTDEYEQIHSAKMRLFASWCTEMNAAFTENNLPLKLHQYYNTFSLDMTCDSYFNWMYVLKLVASDCVFTPGGTTKFTLSFDYDESALRELREIFLRCGQQMIDEYWFYQKPEPHSNKVTMLLVPLLWHNVCRYVAQFVHTIQRDKEIDIGVSHNHPVNRWTHFWSSLGQICVPYVLWYSFRLKFEAMITFLLLHMLRQSGHFFYEAQLKHDEKVKIGYKNATKKKVAVLIPIGIVLSVLLSLCYPFTFSFKKLFVLMGLLAVANRMVDISQCHGYMRSISWLTKIVSDPFTDLYDFYDCWNPYDPKLKWTIDWQKIKQNQKEAVYPAEF